MSHFEEAAILDSQNDAVEKVKHNFFDRSGSVYVSQWYFNSGV